MAEREREREEREEGEERHVMLFVYGEQYAAAGKV